MVLESGAWSRHEKIAISSRPAPPLAIPTTLQDSLAARLDRLGTVKPAGAALRDAGPGLLLPAAYRRVSAFDDTDAAACARPIGPRRVSSPARHAVGSDSTVFKHALIQEVAYQSLLKSRRQQYHERIAEVIVEHFADDAEAHPEVVALHHTRSGRASMRPSTGGKRPVSTRFAVPPTPRRSRITRAACARWNRCPTSVSRGISPSSRLQVELGYSLIPLRGWGALETAQAFTPGRRIVPADRRRPEPVPRVMGRWRLPLRARRSAQALEVADQCLDLSPAGRTTRMR